MSTKQIQEIYQYIQINGNFLSSQKVLKQVQKHPEMIWQIIAKLCAKLKNKNIQNAYAQMVFMLQEPEKHDRSSKWLKQYMDIKDLAIKLGTTYTVLDYLKPEKDKIINFISRIIEVSKGINKLKDQIDQLMSKDDVVSRDLMKYKNLEESTATQLEQLKQRKLNEVPIYEEKVRICQQINKQINFKRQQKLDLIGAQKTLQEQIFQKEKMIEEINFQNEDKSLLIEQLKKEIALNAPEVKKQKRAIEDEYSTMEKQLNFQIFSSKQRQNTIVSNVNQRSLHKDHIIQLVKRIIETFKNLEQAKSKFLRIKEENQRLNARKNQLFRKESQIKDNIHSMQMQTCNLSSAVQNLAKNYFMNEAVYRQRSSRSVQIKKDIVLIKSKEEKIGQYNQLVKNNIEQLRQKHLRKQSELKQKRIKWRQLVMSQIEQVYSPIEFVQYN